MASTIYLLLGSNLGDRKRFLEDALKRLEATEGFEVIAVSGMYVTEPQDVDGPQPFFLNQVIKADFLYTPAELLSATQQIEEDLGRTDKGDRQPRTIDIDILFFSDRLIKTDSLVVPHPELLKRPFAMIPLLQIDPDIIHPETGKPVAEYVNESDNERVILYEDHVARNV